MEGTEDVDGQRSFSYTNMQRGETRCVWRVWRATKSFISDCKNKCSKLYEEKLRLTSATVCAQWLHRRGATRCVRKVWEAGKSFISDCKNKYSRLYEDKPRLQSVAGCAQWLRRRVFKINLWKWFVCLVLCLLTYIITTLFCSGFYSGTSNMPNTATMITVPHLTGDEARNTGKSELRIILIGKAGTGKNSIRNTILGEKQFAFNLTEQSVTKECSKQKVTRKGKDIVLVDIPGLFDLHLPPETLHKEIDCSLMVSSPGPHAFLLVLGPGHYTKKERKAVERLQDIFGKQVMKYMIVVFTHKNDLNKENNTIKNYATNLEGKRLQVLIEKHGSRYRAFNTTASKEEQLITMIDRMVDENNGTYYCNEIYIRAEELIKTKEEEFESKKQKLQQEFEITIKKLQDENKSKGEALEELEREKQKRQREFEITIEKYQEENKAKENELMDEVVRLKKTIEFQQYQMKWNAKSSTREIWTWLDKIIVVWLMSCLLFFLRSDSGC
ncbi:GTPase IMAP family member 4 isoform X2 [Microcaecilia unicolor]|uniref:GTPase IMAP family member 4-like isoform X2 n=1 Tax=Microcaecilia unicolor TaxID=1415580 RepID=A0A6P7XLM7_9AMPH|nr:GTPase IMAP family member 4-like isoform X2 [Microcaecilia unicolor]